MAKTDKPTKLIQIRVTASLKKALQILCVRRGESLQDFAARALRAEETRVKSEAA